MSGKDGPPVFQALESGRDASMDRVLATLVEHCFLSVTRKPHKVEMWPRSLFSARPSPISEGVPGTRMGRTGRHDGPNLGNWRVQNSVKQRTWRIWTGHLRTRTASGWDPGSDPG